VDKIWEKVGGRPRLLGLKGTYYHTIDHKGRLNIPPKFRGRPDSPVADHFVVVRGFEGCLYVYHYESWTIIEEKLSSLKTISDPIARQFIRTIMSNAADVKLDKAGRLIIPKDLLDIANIKKDVILRGVLDKFEIWDPESLKKYDTNQVETYEEIAKQLLL